MPKKKKNPLRANCGEDDFSVIEFQSRHFRQSSGSLFYFLLFFLWSAASSEASSSGELRRKQFVQQGCYWLGQSLVPPSASSLALASDEPRCKSGRLAVNFTPPHPAADSIQLGQNGSRRSPVSCRGFVQKKQKKKPQATHFWSALLSMSVLDCK